jgi:hypothetical protein
MPDFSMQYSNLLDQRGDVLCYNSSGIDIPPYAAMKLNGSFTGSARQVIRPDEDSLDASLIIFNGPQTVPAGVEFLAVNNYEALAMLNGSPSVGDDLGTKEDQWYLDTTTTGFKARGVIQEGLAYAVVFSVGGGGQKVSIPGTSTITSSSNGTQFGDWVELPESVRGGDYIVSSENPPLFTEIILTDPTGASGTIDAYIQFAYDDNLSDTIEAKIGNFYLQKFHFATAAVNSESESTTDMAARIYKPPTVKQITNFRVKAVISFSDLSSAIVRLSPNTAYFAPVPE